MKDLVHIANYNHYGECINYERKDVTLFWNSLREVSGNKSYGTPCLNDDNDNLITDQTVEVQTNEWL